MSEYWQKWLTSWVLIVAAVGLFLMTAAFPETEGLAQGLFVVLGTPVAFDDPLRFAVGLMGAVTLAWAVTLYGAFRLFWSLGTATAITGWRWLLASVVIWYVIDGIISYVTGFGLNIVLNTLLLIGFLIPVVSSGALTGEPGVDW